VFSGEKNYRVFSEKKNYRVFREKKIIVFSGEKKIIVFSGKKKFSRKKKSCFQDFFKSFSGKIFYRTIPTSDMNFFF